LQQPAWQPGVHPLLHVQFPPEQPVQVQCWQAHSGQAQVLALTIVLLLAFAEPPIDAESIITAMLAKMIFFILSELNG
jgi:hypothetical protein